MQGKHGEIVSGSSLYGRAFKGYKTDGVVIGGYAESREPTA